MNRFWQELDRQRQRHASGPDPVDIRCPLGAPPTQNREEKRLVRAWQKYFAYPFLVRRATRRPGAGTVHVLDHSFAHLLGQVPRGGVYKIVTVHDLAPLREPGGLTAAQTQRFRRTVEHLRAADLVLAVSRYTAREVTDLLGVDPARVQVLPEGVDLARFSAPPAGAADPSLSARLAGRKVVLSVGATTPRKNLELLPAIFRAVRAAGVTLLRIGGALPAALAAELRAILGQEGVVEMGPAADEVLIRAYQRADALLLPSRIEGFGFPVLEAMSASCPVVCTDVTSLPEVGGDAALYFAPDDPLAAAEHLSLLLNDPATHATRVAAGLRQAATLSWERHFERLLEIYRGEGRPAAQAQAGR